jgi:inosine-uridine nucleoside N-ribohydrolase
MAIKLIIDTDPGIDDAMALFYAIADPAIDLLALTTVFGNVTTAQATRNALFLLKTAGVDVPVAQGLSQPRKLPAFLPSAHVHGSEGFGTLQVPKQMAQVIPQSAPEFLVRMARKHKGELVLSAIGPLTNVAAALDIDPEFCRNLKRIVIMGGSLGAGGNITSVAEANIYHDPHAADFVFRKGCNITLVGLDVTNRVICPRSYFAKLAEQSPKLGGLLHKMADFYIDFYETVGTFEGCGMHDPSALIACSAPDLFVTEEHKLRVICSGDRSGETVSDQNLAAEPVKVCVGVNISSVKQKFFENVAKLK